MRLTLHTDYALRTLIYLATVDREWTSVREVAEAHDISRPHLGKVAQALSREGFVATRPGRSGGMRLARAPETIVVGDVIRRLEPTLAPVVCLEGGGRERCVITAGCGLIGPMQEATRAFLETLDRYTLADCVKRRKVLREALLRQVSAAGG